MLLSIIIAVDIVTTEPIVLMTTIFPASLLLQPIASAMIKLTTAVGQENKTNIIPRSIFLKPAKYAPKINITGSAISFIAEEVNASPDAFLIFSIFREPPIPINASGNATSARRLHDENIIDGSSILNKENGSAIITAIISGLVIISEKVPLILSFLSFLIGTVNITTARTL